LSLNRSGPRVSIHYVDLAAKEGEGTGWLDCKASSEDPVEAIDAELERATELNNYIVSIEFYRPRFQY
jgi:hypothetical protein